MRTDEQENRVYVYTVEAFWLFEHRFICIDQNVDHKSFFLKWSDNKDGIYLSSVPGGLILLFHHFHVIYSGFILW